MTGREPGWLERVADALLDLIRDAAAASQADYVLVPDPIERTQDMPDESDYTMTTRGALMIAGERARQVTEEGYTVAGDLRRYETSEPLTSAAIVYAMTREQRRTVGDPVDSPAPWPWPWDRETFKPRPSDRISELVKAGALIAAAIDHELAREPAPDGEPS